MKSMKTYVVVWLAGVLAGFILMERWQRASGVQPPAGPNVGDDEQDAAGTAVSESADQPKTATVIVAGARADAQRARHLLGRAMPWGSASAPSLAQLRRAGRATMPANTTEPPA